MDIDYDQEDEGSVTAQPIKDTLTFQINMQYELERYIQSAVTQVVTKRVEDRVDKLVEEMLSKHLNKAIEKIVASGIKLQVKKFDYSGNVVDERSLENVIGEAIKGIQEQGLNYKLESGTGYNKTQVTLADLINNDLKLMMTTKLKPQFEAIEKEFAQKSKEALRQFAVLAVDSANQKTLRGF